MLLSQQSFMTVNAYGYEGGVKAIKDGGFDAYDFSMFSMTEIPNDPLAGDKYKDVCLSLRRYADKIGLVCNQSHAPFPSYKDGDKAYNSGIMDYLARAIEITSLLGGDACVIHPCNNWGPEENAERIYRPLEPYAKKYKVKIALENMWNWSTETDTAAPAACSTAESFLAHLDLLDGEHFTACLDIGHAEMMKDGTTAVGLIHALKGRLTALHVHDNDRTHDLHTIPYLWHVDWESVCKALGEIGYNGDFTFEAGLGVIKYPTELLPSATRFLHDIGRYMISRIEAYRK